MSLIVILSSIEQEGPQEFDDGMELVGTCETCKESIVMIQDHFNGEFDDEYELDWDNFDNQDTVRVKIKEGFGDNNMLELGYVVL